MHASLETALGTDEVISDTAVYDYVLPLQSMGTEYFLVDLVSLSQDVHLEINSSGGVVKR